MKSVIIDNFIPIKDNNFFVGISLDGNCDLHDKLTEHKIPHDFYQRPGGHTWGYWTNAVQYQMLFFSNYFKE